MSRRQPLARLPSQYPLDLPASVDSAANINTSAVTATSPPGTPQRTASSSDNGSITPRLASEAKDGFSTLISSTLPRSENEHPETLDHHNLYKYQITELKVEMKTLKEDFAKLKIQVISFSRRQLTPEFDAINDAESKTPIDEV
ncbi:hypothetical protein HYPSUDRAFT_56506 [Hypholoma sublateritium FD-334 SS-4]|uniref:Uncharacterized protein n=1 Tax=Hypholoma sublateritium (strain FD-334 SS-4) TaxID=945553 RepID=A0A0D2NLD1_HYPSF|nr:hypothetical protein HYPSUDRAFT_56506 [Hypholoma sublateritium FD-334 SS-4]